MGGVGLGNPEFEIDPPILSCKLNDACTVYAGVKANLIEFQEIPEVFESSREIVLGLKQVRVHFQIHTNWDRKVVE